jgi:hypothetical protein
MRGLNVKRKNIRTLHTAYSTEKLIRNLIYALSMPLGYFYLRDVHPERVKSFLERLLEELNSKFSRNFIIRNIEVLSHQPHTISVKASEGKLPRIAWSSMVPFGRYMKRGQRVGFEGYIQQEGKDTILKIAILPRMELFETKEILFMSQDPIEYFVDRGLTKELFAWAESNIYNTFDVDRQYFDKKVLNYLTLTGYRLKYKEIAKELQMDIKKVKEIVKRLESEGKLPP